MRQFLKSTITCMVFLLLAGCCLVTVRSPISGKNLEETVLFHPYPYPTGKWDADPALFEDAEFTADDGTKLHGWFAHAPNPSAIVLCCHGNAGNVTNRRYVLDMFRNGLHASIFVFDYRGYGKSAGMPNERGILLDARAARKWLAKRANVEEKDIVLLGTSLGGGVAVDLAAKDGARALILENTFTSIPEVAVHHYPFLPASWLMQTRLDSGRSIRAYRGPLLQVHGERDRVIPYELGKKLFEAAHEPKTFVTIPGGDHNDPPTPAYYEALKEFLARLK